VTQADAIGVEQHMPGTTTRRRRHRRIVTTALLALAAFCAYHIVFSGTLNPLLYGESSGRDQTAGSRERPGIDRTRERDTAANSAFLRAALKKASPELEEKAVTDALQFVSSIDGR
jgi:hypothetical protein